jgi:prevent-host-death family protein
MKTVNIHEAKTHLSRLVDEAAKGEAFVIAKAGKPMVRVVPLEEEPKKKPRAGLLEGLCTDPRRLQHDARQRNRRDVPW